VKRVIQVAPSNRLQRAQTVADLVVELKEQHVKLNEALRQLSLFSESDVTATAAVGGGTSSGSGSSSSSSSSGSSDTSYFIRHFLLLGS
jgi:hypothetical protein